LLSAAINNTPVNLIAVIVLAQKNQLPNKLADPWNGDNSQRLKEETLNRSDCYLTRIIIFRSLGTSSINKSHTQTPLKMASC